jgi:hypothetical protein
MFSKASLDLWWLLYHREVNSVSAVRFPARILPQSRLGGERKSGSAERSTAPNPLHNFSRLFDVDSIPRNARGDCQEFEILCHEDVGSDYYNNGNPAACTSPHALRSFAFPHYDSSPQALRSVTNMRRCIYGSTLPWTLYAIGEPWQITIV